MFSRSRVARYLALAVSGATLVVYPLSALVLAGPKTPITFRLYPTVASYMHPFFPQNWNLFAPDPISEERGALARYRCGGEQEPSAWSNITERGVDKVQGSRLFPSRESRIVSNAIITRFREDDVLLRLDKRRGAEADADAATPGAAPDDDPVVAELRKASQREKDDIDRVLARYASERGGALCDGRAAHQVQIRYVFHKFPGWSSRHDLSTTGEIETYDTNWITP